MLMVANDMPRTTWLLHQTWVHPLSVSERFPREGGKARVLLLVQAIGPVPHLLIRIMASGHIR